MSMPIQISGTMAETFDLKATAAALRAGPEYANNGRSAQTLAKAPEMNVVLTVINEGVALGEHQAPGSVTLTAPIRRPCRAGSLSTIPATSMPVPSAASATSSAISAAPKRTTRATPSSR